MLSSSVDVLLKLSKMTSPKKTITLYQNIDLPFCSKTAKLNYLLVTDSDTWRRI